MASATSAHGDAINVRLSFKGRIIEKIQISTANGTTARTQGYLVSELKNVAGMRLGLSRERIRLSIGARERGESVKVLDDTKTLISYGITDGVTVTIKDLGPQISWTTVFLIEYLGPILIHLAFYFYFTLIKGTKITNTQYLALLCVCGHFMKREYETLFIHRFSLATMPLTNLFKNCGHYWILSGFLLAYNLYRPEYTPCKFYIVLPAFCMFLLAELGNLCSHLTLRNLRPPGSTKRGIPRGGLFEYVSCPNYTFEILAWISFSIMTGLLSSWIFTIFSGAQMYLWAVKKHRRYNAEFVTYPKSRKALIPFLV